MIKFGTADEKENKKKKGRHYEYIYEGRHFISLLQEYWEVSRLLANAIVLKGNLEKS